MRSVPLVVWSGSGKLHQYTAGSLGLTHCTKGLHSLTAMGLKEDGERGRGWRGRNVREEERGDKEMEERNMGHRKDEDTEQCVEASTVFRCCI